MAGVVEPADVAGAGAHIVLPDGADTAKVGENDGWSGFRRRKRRCRNTTRCRGVLAVAGIFTHWRAR